MKGIDLQCFRSSCNESTTCVFSVLEKFDFSDLMLVVDIDQVVFESTATNCGAGHIKLSTTSVPRGKMA